MQKAEDTPVNPFIAVYYAAQRTSDLINGAQQDIHEFWMTLKDLLNADATSKVLLHFCHHLNIKAEVQRSSRSLQKS